MATKFTHAPWRVKNEFGRLCIIAPMPDLEIAQIKIIGGGEEDFDEAEANANLIATAPDLYRELEKCAKLLRSYEHHHLQKCDREKAERNRRRAENCERVLANARGEK